MTKPIRVAMIDDHALFRTSVCETLNREEDIEIVAEAKQADVVMTLVPKCAPDVLLLDIDMPGLNSFDAARQVSSAFSDVRVIMVSAFYTDKYIEQALAANARGYVTKDEDPRALVNAIRVVHSDQLYFSPAIWARLVVGPKGISLVEDASTAQSKLTIREVEVLRYLAEGLSKKQIAATMHVSVNTVNRHTVSIMDKLDIHDRVELARYAIREGFVEA